MISKHKKFVRYAPPETFPLGSAPYDLTYGEWSTEWWKWLDRIPEDRSPAADTTGTFCAETCFGSKIRMQVGLSGSWLEHGDQKKSEAVLYHQERACLLVLLKCYAHPRIPQE